jgi:hypothetical protein
MSTSNNETPTVMIAGVHGAGVIHAAQELAEVTRRAIDLPSPIDILEEDTYNTPEHMLIASGLIDADYSELEERVIEIHGDPRQLTPVRGAMNRTQAAAMMLALGVHDNYMDPIPPVRFGIREPVIGLRSKAKVDRTKIKAARKQRRRQRRRRKR